MRRESSEDACRIVDTVHEHEKEEEKRPSMYDYRIVMHKQGAGMYSRYVIM